MLASSRQIPGCGRKIAQFVVADRQVALQLGVGLGGVSFNLVIDLPQAPRNPLRTHGCTAKDVCDQRTRLFSWLDPSVKCETIPVKSFAAGQGSVVHPSEPHLNSAQGLRVFVDRASQLPDRQVVIPG